MTLREELKDYADQSSALIKESPQMDEENTKRKIIEPLIELLGWDILSSDVELEYSIQIGSGTKKVDYALKLEDTPVVFVEAKGCDTALDQNHEKQLTSYMRQVGVDWGLLSNGREFEIFRRDEASTRPKEISLAEFSVENIMENEHPVKALVKSSISSGESRQIAEKIEAVQDSIKSLRKNKETIAEDVTGVVTDVAGNSASQQIEDEAKSFVDNLITTLEEQAHRKGIDQHPIGGEEGEDDDNYVIRVTRNSTEIYRIVEEMQSEAVAALVTYLIEEEELLEEIEVPYIPGTGQGTRALLNDEPEHTNGKKMKGFQSLAQDYYLLTNLSSEDKIRYISELPEKVGLDCEFSGGW